MNSVVFFLATTPPTTEVWQWHGLTVGDIAAVLTLAGAAIGVLLKFSFWLFRRRPRLKVEMQTIALWEAAKDGQPDQIRTLLQISVRSLRGAHGIERFELEWKPEPFPGWEWIEVPALGGTVNPKAHVMQQDEFEQRHFEFYVFSDDGTGNRYELRASVHLVDGKKYKSKRIPVVAPVKKLKSSTKPYKRPTARHTLSSLAASSLKKLLLLVLWLFVLFVGLI